MAMQKTASEASVAGTTRLGTKKGHPATDAAHSRRLPPLLLAALGVVYGDIGTSPLYTLRECFGHVVGLPLTEGKATIAF